MSVKGKHSKTIFGLAKIMVGLSLELSILSVWKAGRGEGKGKGEEVHSWTKFLNLTLSSEYKSRLRGIVMVIFGLCKIFEL